MRIEVTIPDDVFEAAEELRRASKCSRSELYSRALAEYVARHDPDHVREAMDRAIEEIGQPDDAFAVAASLRILRRVEW